MQKQIRKGRKDRKENPIISSSVEPGMLGGRYKPLSENDEKNISNTIFDVLEKIGMADPIPILLEHALKRGCIQNEHGRLCFPRALVEDVIDKTPKNIQFMGRDPKHDLEIGGL
jgi:trimethylamine--corrinoid protein Co-methyltransferase